MILRHSRRLSRRRFVSLASAAGAGLLVPASSLARPSDVTNLTPYYAQGQTGSDSINNCGPATVAAAMSYSGVAKPSVEELRNALGFNGPTSTDQWTALLDLYNVPWKATWSKSEIDTAVADGSVVIIAAWMADLSYAPDFEQPRSPNQGQVGRYDGFSFGHSMLIVGSADGLTTYQLHDPNVFHDESTDWYADGSPKGAYRRYNASEIWNTVRAYAGGFGIAVSPPASAGTAPVVRKVDVDAGGPLIGPAGGRPAQRGLTSSPATPGAIPRVLTNTITQVSRRATGDAANVK